MKKKREGQICEKPRDKLSSLHWDLENLDSRKITLTYRTKAHVTINSSTGTMAATRSHAIARLVLRQIATSPVVQLSKRRQNSSTRSVRCHSAARELVLLPCSSRQLPLAFRSFATSSTSRSPSPEKVIKDPYHPSGIYFHQLPESDQYAISFLSTPPSSPTSASIVAFVTPPPSTRTPIYDLIVEKPDLVIANKAFTQLMHDTLKQECVPQDGLLEYEAALRKDGWAHLNGALEGHIEGDHCVDLITHVLNVILRSTTSLNAGSHRNA
jgi:hypothetical protein